jgi:tRNA uridine 5-carboxymethylaminomethyl modification enzyme
MIDDLVTRGVDEPYRMFTSRAEYRLMLRQDNADRRLTPVARQVGLVDDQRWQRLQDKEAEITRVIRLLESRRWDEMNLAKFLRRPEIGWNDLTAQVPDLAQVCDEVATQVTHDVKYAGYVQRQMEQVERQRRLASKRIPEQFDFDQLTHLRTEARQKLAKIRPTSIDQASRISGITPADIALLMAHLQSHSDGP